MGWALYSIFILATFLVIKTVNFRLHKALDMNPEEDEEEEEEEEEEGGGKQGEEEKKSPTVEGRREEEGEGERKELGLDGRVIEPSETKADGGVTLPGQVDSKKEEEEEEREDMEESLRKHRDSASTLGQSSAHQSSPEDALTATLQLVEVEEGRGGEASLLGMIEAEVEGRRSRSGEGEGEGGGGGGLGNAHSRDRD